MLMADLERFCEFCRDARSVRFRANGKWNWIIAQSMCFCVSFLGQDSGLRVSNKECPYRISASGLSRGFDQMLQKWDRVMDI